jgi:hypothetical protein
VQVYRELSREGEDMEGSGRRLFLDVPSDDSSAAVSCSMKIDFSEKSRRKMIQVHGGHERKDGFDAHYLPGKMKVLCYVYSVFPIKWENFVSIFPLRPAIFYRAL